MMMMMMMTDGCATNGGTRTGREKPKYSKET
jgi:hypothetical protein